MLISDQLSGREIRMFERVAGDTLELYGYDVVTPSHLRTPVGRVEARIFWIQNIFMQALTTSPEYYRRAIIKRIQAAQSRFR